MTRKTHQEEDDELNKVHVFAVKEPKAFSRWKKAGSAVTDEIKDDRERRRSEAATAQKPIVESRYQLQDVDGLPASFAGKIQRNPVTGKCYMDDVSDELDFTLVDLYDRDYDETTWSSSELAADMYLMTARPLLARSWLYQELFTQSRTRAFNVYTTSIRNRIAYSFALKVRDDHPSGCYGGASPCKCLAPMLFITGLTEDFASLIIVFLAFIISLSMSIYCNQLDFYRSGRLLTLPIRWLVFVWNLMALVEFSDYVQDRRYHVVLAVFVNVALCLYDLGEDIASWWSPRNETSWDVLTLLPGKVMVCSSTSMHSRKKMEYPFDICGADKGDDIVLIAEIHGIFCILEPLQQDQSDSLIRWYNMNKGKPRVFCTRTYSDEYPRAVCFDEMGMPKMTEVSQLAQRDAMIHKIKQMEMKDDKQAEKRKEQDTIVVEAPKYKKFFDYWMRILSLGPVTTPGHFEKLRHHLLGIEILDERVMANSILWVEEQKKRREDPHYLTKKKKSKKGHPFAGNAKRRHSSM